MPAVLSGGKSKSVMSVANFRFAARSELTAE
jgi:hypothetical protein